MTSESLREIAERIHGETCGREDPRVLDECIGYVEGELEKVRLVFGAAAYDDCITIAEISFGSEGKAIADKLRRRKRQILEGCLVCEGGCRC